MKFRNFAFISVILLMFSSFSVVNAADIIYPLKKISKSACRFQDYSTLDNDCLQDLPILKTQDYEKLKNDYDYRRVYTVLWQSTYDYGWDVWNWSHIWVDIATSKWTPTYAITDWTILYAWAKTGRWNVVTIQHKVNWKTIYSNYAHLSKWVVKTWDKVSTWDKIWEVWSSWNSTWNHLHFQIDINQWVSNHPYYYYQNCVWDSWSIVNQWLCRDDLVENTLDPLLFLETAWAIITSSWDSNQIVDKEVIEDAKNANISQGSLSSQKEIEEREIKEFLKNYTITFKYSKLGSNVPVWEEEVLKFMITEKRTWKPFTWTLPDYMNFVWNKTLIKIFPDRIRVAENWTRDISILGLKEGRTTVYVRIWSLTIYTKTIDVYDPKYSPTIKSASIRTQKWVYLWSESKWLALLIWGDNNINLISLPYSWKYRITLTNWKLCPFNYEAPSLSQEIKTYCSPSELVDYIDFDYKNSYQWIPIFGVKPNTSSSMKMSIISLANNTVLAERTIKTYLPKNLKSTYTYYNSVIWTLKLGITEVKSWYFLENRVIDERDAVNWIKSYLSYRIETETSLIKKQQYKSSLSKISWFSWGLNKQITRLEMLDLIVKYVPVETRWDAISYRDLSAEQSQKANLIFNTTYTWKDDFGEKYFQPKNKLTRWEAAYMIRQLLR